MMQWASRLAFCACKKPPRDRPPASLLRKKLSRGRKFGCGRRTRRSLSSAEATHCFASPHISALRLHITFSCETRKRKAVFDEGTISKSRATSFPTASLDLRGSCRSRQFPTIERVAIPPSGGVSFYIVMSMKPRYAGEARSALLAAISTNPRPKTVVVVDPDIDVHSCDQVEWAMAFSMQPRRDVIIVDSVPAGPLDPSVDDSIALDARTGSAIGIDATYPFGAEVKSTTDVPAAGHVFGPAVAEHGHEFFEVAAVPGWQRYDFPELRNRGAQSPQG
jgi:3-octaprenyl-4-hydroxybenzoate carboxy-lyase